MATKTQQIQQLPAEHPGEEVVADHREFYELVVRRLAIPESPAVPGEILLGSLPDGRLRVNSPVRVRFTSEDHHIIAEAVEFNEFGFGENASEALIDLQHAIVELYFTLEEEQGRLGNDLQNLWANLQRQICKR